MKIGLGAGLLSLLLTGCQLGPVRVKVAVPEGACLLGRQSIDGEQRIKLQSDLFQVDRGMESMSGPSTNLDGFTLAHESSEARKTYWIKGMKSWAESSGSPVLAEEFICHQNLGFAQNWADHNRQFDPPHHLDGRLLTLVQGRLEIRLPKGFGLPVKAGARLHWDSMVHHLNFQAGEPAAKVRIFLEVDYLKGGQEDGQPLQPLFRRAVYLFDRKAFAKKMKLRNLPPDELCAPGDRPQAMADNPIHIQVPPGTHRFEMDLDDQWKLPFDTTVHYISGHLHTHHDWMRLVDAESGQALVELSGHNYPGRRGLQQIRDWSSQQGIPLRKRGRYKLVVQYTNPTSEPIDAMAILYLHMLDRQPQAQLKASL
jgi:hypothetical protein